MQTSSLIYVEDPGDPPTRDWGGISSWCAERDFHPVSAPVRQVLEYLHSLYERGRAASTLKVTVAALSAFHAHIDGSPLACCPLVIRLLRAVKQTRPLVRSLAPPWCLGSILSVLSKPPFGPLSSCDIRLLSWKTAFLLAVCSA